MRRALHASSSAAGGARGARAEFLGLGWPARRDSTSAGAQHEGHELSLRSWRSGHDPLNERAFEQMVGVSTRRYARSLEPLPQEVAVHGISKSTVSERFVVGTQRRLAELMRRDLSGLKLVALMIDWVHFAEHVVLAAVGIDLWRGCPEWSEAISLRQHQ